MWKAAFLFILFLVLLSNYVNAQPALVRNDTWSQNLTGLIHSSLAFGDVDNDGDLDLVLAGCTSGGDTSCSSVDKTRICINDGITLTESQTWQQNLVAVGWGSLAFGDIDRDGDLDLALLGYDTSTGLVKIYTNDGTTFTEDSTWGANLTGINAYGGSLAFGDVDSDGDLDLALVGSDTTTENGVYTNNGTTFVKNSTWLNQIPVVGQGLGLGVVVWGDVNNDNYLDLVFSGSKSTNFYDNVYRNNGTSLVGDSDGCHPCGLWGFPSQTLGDYDNDGDLDLAYMGTKTGDRLYIYDNNGTDFIQGQLLVGLFDGSVSWGDYDNDGDLDIVGIGKETGRNRIFAYNGTSFEVDSIAGNDLQSDDMQQGSLAWIDIDNDDDLDLASGGNGVAMGSFLAKVYINNITTTNTAPSPATSFINVYVNNKLNLSWNSGSDTETPTNGLYYNLRVGTCSGCHDVVSGVYGGSSNPTAGYFGNMMQRKSISLNIPLASDTTFYWTVQTIDTGLKAGSWSSEQVYAASANGGTTTTVTTTTTTTTVAPAPPSGNGGTTNGGTSGGSSGRGTIIATTTTIITTVTTTITLPLREVTKTIEKIVPEVVEEVSIEAVDVKVSKISISVKNEVSNVQIVVQKVEYPTAIVPKGEVYQYVEITSKNITSEDVENVTLDFKVEKSWIDENSIDKNTVALNRYTAGWEKLPTVLVSEDDEFVYYEAVSSGFSVFAITGEIIIVSTTTTIPEQERDSNILIGIVIGILAIIGLYFFAKRHY